MDSNGTVNSSPEMIILTIVVLLILLYSIVTYHKSNYNNIGLIIGISLFFIFVFDYFSKNSILNSFKENFTNLSNAPQLYSTYFAFIAFILVLIGLSISKNKLLSDSNSNYPFVITIITTITAFFIFSIYVQHYIGKNRNPDTYGWYFFRFLLVLVACIGLFITISATQNENYHFAAKVVIISAVLISVLVFYYFNPNIFVDFIDNLKEWLSGDAPLPKIFRDLYNLIKKEFSQNSFLAWILLLGIGLSTALLFYGEDVSHNIIKFLTHDGKHLLHDVVDLNEEHILGNFQTLSNQSFLDTNTDYDQDSNYCISSWFYLNKQYSNNNDATILDYGNNPHIKYMGSENKLIITFNVGADSATTPKEIIVENILIQKWNNIVVNCRSGRFIDVFLNTELVATSSDILINVKKSSQYIKLGYPNLEGSACNVVYYNHTLPITSIYTLYYLYSSMNPPYINYSKNVENKEKNKTFKSRDFETENESRKSRDRSGSILEDDSEKYDANDPNNVLTYNTSMPGIHSISKFLWFFN
jgi:hypothetical protein